MILLLLAIWFVAILAAVVWCRAIARRDRELESHYRNYRR